MKSNTSTKESKNTESVFSKIFNNVVKESDSLRKVKVVTDPADRREEIEENKKKATDSIFKTKHIKIK